MAFWDVQVFTALLAVATQAADLVVLCWELFLGGRRPDMRAGGRSRRAIFRAYFALLSLTRSLPSVSFGVVVSCI